MFNPKGPVRPNGKIMVHFITFQNKPFKNSAVKLEWVLKIANATGTNGLTCLPKYGGARDNKFLVTHPKTGH
jgi:hypothetical protein